MPGVLYMVATPLGNLGDTSTRSKEILSQVNAVVCEDTRVTRKLLEHFSISKPLVSCHHHSHPKVYQGLMERLLAGESLAYASDAGTPGISDPGGKLVAAAVAAGVTVVPVPGPSAVTTLLSVAGFNTDSYLFLGFPPHKKGRQTFFKEVAACTRAVVFFESTHRISKALAELCAVMPERQIVVGRELTKLYETIYRGTPPEVVEQLTKTSSKGEFVIAIAPQK